MKKILIITPDSGYFLREYINYVLDESDYDVTVMAIQSIDESSVDRKVTQYALNNKDHKIIFLRFINYYSRIQKFLPQIGTYDIVHIQFMDRRMLKLSYPVWSKAKKLIVTFWGSDLLRVNRRCIDSYIGALTKAGKIILMSESMRTAFKNKYQGAYLDKTEVIDFGNGQLDTIKKLRECYKTEEIKEEWSVNDRKIVIHIGYNGIPEQQHIPILDALSKLPPDIQDKIFLVLPFNYGGHTDYHEAVKRKLRGMKFDYLFVEDFYEGLKLAKFRMMPDIVIYAQTTDALSCSITEYLYAGALLVKPSWLDYTDFEDQGLYDITYDKIEEVTGIIQELIVKGIPDKRVLQKKADFLYEMKSWNSEKAKWQQLYE